MAEHRSQLQLSKTAFLDLMVVLALCNRTLAEWVAAEIVAGLAEPPRLCIRPAMGSDPVSFTIPLSDEIVQGAWGVAKALAVDSGERVTAGDVYAVLLTRAARRDTIELRATRGDDFDFVAWQFAALRAPGDEHPDAVIVKRLNSIIEGVDLSLELVPPATGLQRNAEAQAAADAARAAERDRAIKAAQAEQARQDEERARLQRLLA